MLALLVSLVATAEPRPSSARLLDSHVSAGVAVLGASYTVFGARLGDALVTPVLTGRVVFGGFVVDGGAMVAAPVARGGAGLSVTGSLRAGWSGEAWSLVGGVVLQVTPEAVPSTQLVPTLRGQLSFGKAGVSVGVFDFVGQVPLHVSAELGPFANGRFSLGWVAPLGIIASADLWVTKDFGVRLAGFGYRLGNTETAMGLLSVTYGGAR